MQSKIVLVVELDTLSVVLIMKNCTCNLLMEPLLTDCRNLLKMFPNMQVVYAYREANQYANALTKLSANLNYVFVTFDHLPNVVDNLLTLDKVTNVCNRLISIYV